MLTHVFVTNSLVLLLFVSPIGPCLLSGFIIQFGIASEPDETTKWDTTLPDDPMLVQPNVRGTISFATAGPNTRTTQLFINTQNNQDYLDRMGFTPIGIILDDAMDTIVPYIATPIVKNGQDGIDQDHYTKYGNVWLLKHYPEVDLIWNTTLLTAVNDNDNIHNVHESDLDETDDHVDAIGRISPNEAVNDPQSLSTHRFSNRQYNNNNEDDTDNSPL